MSDSTLWFEQKEGASGRAFAYAEALDTARAEVMSTASRNYVLYDGRGALDESNKRLSPLRERDDLVDENIVKSVTDTAMALVVNSTPVPAFLTDNVSFSMHRNARELARYIEGLFQTVKFWKKGRMSFFDACVATGHMKITADNVRGRPRFERVTIDRLLVDEWQCVDGKAPESLERIFADRRALAKKFPKHKKDIMGARVSDAFAAISDGRHPASMQIVEVLECFRVPSEPGGTDGRHGIFIQAEGNANGGVLLWEKWTREEIPYVPIRWTDPSFGYYGTPLVDEIAGMQIRVHKNNERWEECIDRLAFPTQWARKGDELSVTDVPDVGRVGYFTQEAPTMDAPRVVPPDLIIDSERRIANAFKFSGVGEWAAFQKKPADVRSGPGFREVNDTQSQRFINPHLAWEEFSLECGRHALIVTSEMHAAGKIQKAKWNSHNRATTIPWEKVMEGFDEHAMYITASSILARSPAGRKDLAMELYNGGIIDGPKTLRLLDIPDVDRETDLLNAAEDAVRSQLERLEDAENVTPDEFQNMEMCFALGTLNLNRLIPMRDVPEEVMAAHRRYVKIAEAKMRQRAEAAQAKAAADAQQIAAAEGAAEGTGQSAAIATGPPAPPTEQVN